MGKIFSSIYRFIIYISKAYTKLGIGNTNLDRDMVINEGGT